jgi:demethylmenaquinone methyltransferase/2-methoxy-6-polyprenyl-1,4-benzoquinol methylase
MSTGRGLAAFLDGLHRRLEPGAVVLLADNVHLPGVGGELVTRPGGADTWKLRTLADGSQHAMLKSYFDTAELDRILGPRSRDLDIHVGACFWLARYRVAAW